ncbi:MAG: zinc-ribbon domain containing protein [Candidatus Competibacteraceae bacterium]|nr:zinc-ribbon domain containing protein [Candidatus Competibacteraceae bacterium]
MKSNKQRRQEIKAQRLRRTERQIQIRRAAARPVNRPVGTEPVTPALLRSNNSYGIPDFVQRGYYQDRPFRCKGCGVEEVWTAAQQRGWYEVAQGEVWTVRCRPCRQQERERKAEARRIHREGLAERRNRTLFKVKSVESVEWCNRI